LLSLVPGGIGGGMPHIRIGLADDGHGIDYLARC